MIYKPINEVSDGIWELLYSLCFNHDKKMTVSEYAKLYEFVVVDDVVYSTPDASNRVKLFEENEHSFFFGMCLPDAIIKNRSVIKNRYGAKNN